jgi:translocation and assembly module TamA
LRLILAWGFLMGATAPPLHAEALRAVEIRGLDGDELENVRATLSLTRLRETERRELTEARLSYLVRRAKPEAMRALQPYGYYDARIETQVEHDSRGVTVVLQIERGEPIIVTSSDIVVEGEAGTDAQVESLRRRFEPRVGRRLDQRRYEASKLALQRRLLERGYFDAVLLEHRIELQRRAREAALRLRWQSGVRHRFGPARFDGGPVRTELLAKTVPFTPGEPFHQRELLKLHQRLTDLDYFSYIDVRPELDAATDAQVPILVELAPGKRTIYTAGVSYGTDSGAGVQLGLERRWVNERGHKFASQIDWAQRRESLSLLYRIPAFAWADGWYAIGANRRDEESEFVASRITELVAQRTGRREEWNLGLALHLRNEKFRIGEQVEEQAGNPAGNPGDQGEQRLVYPALTAERKRADDELYPSRGYSLRGEFKLGDGAIGSQVDFAQVLLEAKWIRTLGESNRLLLRAQLGRTQTDDIDDLPPSLRFFAGGDRSIRGYGYQEVGPRIDDKVVGGSWLATGSVEFEHMFSERWGAAVFVDSGDAFRQRDAFQARTGVGAGVRWRSPVGLVRLDLAHGLNQADNTVQVHINIGPDL